MATTNANAMANKVSRAQALVTFINGFGDYKSARKEESLGEMQQLLDQLIAAGAGETASHTRYHEAIKDRNDIFFGENGSVLNTMIRLKKAVESQYGKDSSEAGSVAILLRKVNTNKMKREETAIVTTPSEGTDPAAVTTPAEAITRSRSKRSYSILARVFAELVATVRQFPEFSPTNPMLEVAQLEKQLEVVTNIGNAVNASLQSVQVSRSDQNTLVTDFQERTRRIKANVMSQYGTQSKEYKMIRGIRI
jgi:hypothetical protein